MSFPVDKAIFHILSHFVSNNSEIDEARRSNICSASYGLQNSPTYMTSLNAHPHSLLMCTQNAYLIVVLYMQTFCLWKWKSPWRMSNLALSIHGTPLHFSKSCSRKTLSLPLPHRRGWSGGKLSKVAQERRAPPCGPGRGVCVEDSWREVPLAMLRVVHTDVVLSPFSFPWSGASGEDSVSVCSVQFRGWCFISKHTYMHVEAPILQLLSLPLILGEGKGKLIWSFAGFSVECIWFYNGTQSSSSRGQGRREFQRRGRSSLLVFLRVGQREGCGHKVVAHWCPLRVQFWRSLGLEAWCPLRVQF